MTTGLTNPVDPAGSHITGEARTKLGEEIRKRYEGGESIRALSTETGRSYGFINTLLKEAGTTLRSRGGARQKV